MKSTSRRSSVPSHRRHRERRLLLEQLERRALLATLYVDNSPTIVGPGADEFTPTGGTQTTQTGLTQNVDLFTTIQAAVTAATAGDTINVADGTYNEIVAVNKTLTLQGNQFGVDARSGRGASETIVDANGSNQAGFSVTASNSILDGFTIQNSTNGAFPGFGIVLGAGTSGAQVLNNIIQDNIAGISLANTGATQARIQFNLIQNNNQPGPVSGHGIYTDQFNAGGTLSNVLIDSNSFVGHTGQGIGFSSTSAVAPATGITVSNNLFDGNGRALYAFNLTSSSIVDNTIQNSIDAATADIRLFEGVNGLTIERNVLENGAGRAVRINNAGTGSLSATGVSFRFNSVSGYTGPSGTFQVDAGGYVGTLDATRNWWGSITGPTIATNPGGTGATIDDPLGVVDFQPWLVYSPDADAATAGVQLVTAFDVPAQTADFTTTNNNYRRLVNVIESIQPGQAASLSGTFDWTEANAAASWALGNDDVSGTADDYSLLAPANINNATITAAALGDATIQGPGDLAGANLEGVFVFDGGDNQDWTLSNLQIFDFDLSIGFFNGAGGADAFNGTTITNNLLHIPADLNTIAAPADVNQNIGIHYSFGTNQTISDNVLEIDGSGTSVSATTNFSSTVGMQSNTSGGAVYDGLLIDNNTLNVNGVLAADPASIIGIWENAHAHTSDITVSNNDVLNLTTGGTPATNLIRGFRVTSHSSATTNVTYSGNTVSGANLGFQWLAGQNFAGNQPVRLWNNTITGSETGVLIQSNGSANLLQNTITGSGAGGAVHVLTGQLAASGLVTNAVQENVITGGSGDGILIDVTAGTIGSIFNNNLSGNAGLGVNNQSVALIDASGNWWGSNTPSGVAAEAGANVDYTPWLDSGADTSGNAGFQGDFNALHVDDNSPQVGGGRITEGLDLLLGGGTLTIHSGTYVEDVDVTTQGATLVLGSGAANVEIDGNLTLDNDDFLELDLGNNPGTTGDLLDVSGAALLGNATVTLSALEPINAGNTLVVLKRGTGNDVFGNVAQLEQLTVDGNFVTARYDLADGNDFGFVTQQNPSIGNAGGTLNYTEDDPPTLIVPTATVSDLDQAVFNGGYLQVLISENAEATDILAIRSVGNGPGQIQVVGDEVQYEGNTFGFISGGAGTPLQIDFDSSGNATLEAVQALVRSITFESTSDAPATTKKALFFLDDGTGGTGAINKNIAITLVNDAPVLDTSLNPTLNTISEDATNPAGTQVSSLLAGAFSDPDGPGLQGIAVSAASSFHGEWEYSLDAGATWNSMGTPSATAALLLPDSAFVRFIPDANFNGEVKLWYHAWDQTEGSAGGTLSARHNPDTASVGNEWEGAALTVLPVNDVPVLDTSLNPTLRSTSEDAQVPASTLVADLIAGAISDVDEGAVEGIAVSAASSFHGDWEYSLDGGATWTSMGTPSASAALLLPDSARVRFDPHTDFNGTVKLYYHAWDQTEGSAGGALSARHNPDTASVGNEWEGASLTVLPVNDAPVLTLSGTVGYVHDTAPIQLAPNATVSDIDSDDFDTGRLRVHITDGADGSNRLGIGAGFTVDADDNVLQGATVIGKRTSNGFGTNDLVIRFNANATPFRVQQLVRAITFKTVGGSAGDRKVVFDVKDGDGGLSNEAFKTVNVT